MARKSGGPRRSRSGSFGGGSAATAGGGVRHNACAPNLNRPRAAGDGSQTKKKKRRPKKRPPTIRKHVVGGGGGGGAASTTGAPAPRQRNPKSLRKGPPSGAPGRPRPAGSMPENLDGPVPWLSDRGDGSTEDGAPIAAGSSPPTALEDRAPPPPPPSHGFAARYARLLPDAALRRALDAEVEALAHYVRLSAAEHRARHAWLERLRGLVRATFGGGAAPAMRHHPAAAGGGGGGGLEPQLTVYGSFATPEVCLFSSDVDTALWGVLPGGPRQPPPPGEVDDAANDNSAGPAPRGKRLAPGTEVEADVDRRKRPRRSEDAPRRPERVKQWRLALRAAEEEATAAATTTDGAATVASTATGPHNVTEGDSDEDDDSSTRHDSDLSDGDFADKLAGFAMRRLPDARGTGQSRRYGPTESNGSRRRAIIDSDIEDSDEDEGDDAALVPLTLSCSDSESEAGEDDCGPTRRLSDGDLCVSFVARHDGRGGGRDAVPLPPRLDGRTRGACVDALARLATRLRRAPHAVSVELIKKARVPIIKMQSDLGFEADVAIGGHNGTDTSAFSASQVNKYKSFGPVTLLLKTLLAQQQLDTPYTGGLGSYKLYVLLAFHLERHLAAGGRDEPGEVFLAFLYRYGVADSGGGCCTRLRQDQPVVAAEGRAAADLSNVFLLESCVSLFRRSWARMEARLRELTRRRRHHPSHDRASGPPPSALAAVLDGPALRRARHEAVRSHGGTSNAR